MGTPMTLKMGGLRLRKAGGFKRDVFVDQYSREWRQVQVAEGEWKLEYVGIHGVHKKGR
jgi:hypothetical protein